MVSSHADLLGMLDPFLSDSGTILFTVITHVMQWVVSHFLTQTATNASASFGLLQVVLPK